jgi:hypothetical protein
MILQFQLSEIPYAVATMAERIGQLLCIAVQRQCRLSGYADARASTR